MPDLLERRESHYRFGSFELDLGAGELRKSGMRVHLQEQPLRVLQLLLARPGELVTREELRQRLWPADTFVDFDAGLNNAVRRLREALGDSADAPRFVETVAKRGYRFLAPVERPEPPAEHARSSAGPSSPFSLRGWPILLAAAALVVAVAALIILRRASAPAPGKVMLAVLPFANLDGDQGEEYFSDGLTDEMIARLGALQPDGLGVIARTSAMQYKRSPKRADQIGRELGVEYLLEGGVRRAGGRVRITARLIQLSDQTPLLSREFEGDVKDVLALQKDVALSVAEEIRLRLSQEARARLATARPVIPRAYEECLRGRYAWNQRRAEALREALANFEEASARDPTYAPAHTGLADTYSLLSLYGGMPPREVFPKARSAAERALSLDPQQAEAHTSLAYVLHRFDWEWEKAGQAYRRAIALNPSYATAHHWYGEYLMVMGRLPAARQEMRAAQQLDPLSPRINLDVGLADYFEGRHDAAIAVARRVADLHPSFVPAQIALRQAYERKGLFGEAVQALERTAQGLGVDTRPAEEVRAAVAASGSAGYWRTLLGLAERGWPLPVSAAHRANMCAALGEREQALAWLERAYQERDDELVWIAVEPWYEPLRGEPRFTALLTRMGLRAAAVAGR